MSGEVSGNGLGRDSEAAVMIFGKTTPLWFPLLVGVADAEGVDILRRLIFISVSRSSC